MGNCRIDYALKSRILNENQDLIVAQKRCSLYEYALRMRQQEGVVLYALKQDKYYQGYEQYYDALFKGKFDLLEECYKINHAEYERTKRLKQRVSSILLNGSCFFLTLTFTDFILANTTEKQRRVAVSRYLKSYNGVYVANIDYGAKNHREHYHALISCNKIDCKTWSKYGNLDFEKVHLRDYETDKTKLSKYIAKLSNHAIKETARRGALLYSR